MTEAVWFGLIAVLAFAGWTYTLVRLCISLLPMANTAKVLQQIIEREDKMVESMVSRLERARNRGAEPPGREQQQPQRPTQRDAENPLAHIFPGFVETPIIDQPDSGIEVVE